MRHNRDMHMSVEMITIVLVAVSFVIVLNGIIFAGLAWFLRRMNKRFDELNQGFDELSYKLRAV